MDMIIEFALIILPGITLYTFCQDLSTSSKKMCSAVNVLVACFSIKISPKSIYWEVAKTILKHMIGHTFHIFGYAVVFFVILMPHHNFMDDDTDVNATVFSDFSDSFLKVLLVYAIQNSRNPTPLNLTLLAIQI